MTIEQLLLCFWLFLSDVLKYVRVACHNLAGV